MGYQEKLSSISTCCYRDLCVHKWTTRKHRFKTVGCVFGKRQREVMSWYSQEPVSAAPVCNSHKNIRVYATRRFPDEKLRNGVSGRVYCKCINQRITCATTCLPRNLGPRAVMVCGAKMRTWSERGKRETKCCDVVIGATPRDGQGSRWHYVRKSWRRGEGIQPLTWILKCDSFGPTSWVGYEHWVLQLAGISFFFLLINGIFITITGCWRIRPTAGVEHPRPP